MNNSDQLSLGMPANNSWAFASRRGNRTKFKIISSSKEARALGVHEGMEYYAAKQLVPDLKVLMIGRR